MSKINLRHAECHRRWCQSAVFLRWLCLSIMMNFWLSRGVSAFGLKKRHNKEGATSMNSNTSINATTSIDMKTQENDGCQSSDCQQHEHRHRRRLSHLFSLFRMNDTNHWSHILDHGSLDGFPSYKEAEKLLDTFVAQHPNFVIKYQVGRSVQERPIWAYRIGRIKGQGLESTDSGQEPNESDSTSLNIYDVENQKCLSREPTSPFNLSSYYQYLSESSTKTLPQILITSLHHAREPAALTAVLFFIGQLLELGTQPFATSQSSPASDVVHNAYEFATVSLCRHILDYREIVVLPFVNPDGYIAMEEKNSRKIRKNQRVTCPERANDIHAQGVDLNRNYDYSFANAHKPCDAQEYEGPSAFSEPETQAVKCLIDSRKFKLALNFHAFGDFWTHPFNCCNDMELPVVIQDIYDEMKNSVVTSDFNNAPNVKVLGYNTTGESDDWMLGKRGILALSPELGIEQYGFWPPQHAIANISHQIFWNIAEAVKKTGSDISVVLQRIKGTSASDDVFDIQFFNHGLSSDEHNSTLVVWSSANDTSSPLHSMRMSQISTWKSFDKPSLFNTSGPSSSVPFSPSFLLALQTDPARSLDQPSPPSQNNPPVVETLLLSVPVLPLKPRSGSQSIRLPVKENSELMTVVCLYDGRFCRCSAVPFPSVSLVSPLIVTDFEDPLCQAARNFVTGDKTNVSVAQQLPSVPERSASFLLRHNNDTLLVSLFIATEVVVTTLLLFVFCLIVSVDPEEAKTTCGQIATSITLPVTKALCCFPACLRLHQKIQWCRDKVTAADEDQRAPAKYSSISRQRKTRSPQGASPRSAAQSSTRKGTQRDQSHGDGGQLGGMQSSQMLDNPFGEDNDQLLTVRLWDLNRADSPHTEYDEDMSDGQYGRFVIDETDDYEEEDDDADVSGYSIIQMEKYK